MIAVIIVRAAPEHVRGYVGRFLTEVEAGVFVGRTSPRVAENLWARISTDLPHGSLTMLTEDKRQEQGFTLQTSGSNPAEVVDLDGLQLTGKLIYSKEEDRGTA